MDVDEARVRRYAEAITGIAPSERLLYGTEPGYANMAKARAVIAVADEEQAELRAEIEELRAAGKEVLSIFAVPADAPEA